MRHLGQGRCFPTMGTAVDGSVAASGAAWVDREDADRGAAAREERPPSWLLPSAERAGANHS